MTIETFQRQHLQQPQDPYQALCKGSLDQRPVRTDWTIWN